MTMFQFAANAFYALVGGVCILIGAALIVGTVIGIISIIKKARGKDGNDSY